MIDLLDRLKSHKVLSYSGTQDILLDASFHIAGDLTVSGSYPSGGGTGTAGSTFIGSLWTTSEAQGDLIYRNATGWTRLAAGTSGNFLKTAGAAEDPVWASTTVTDTSSLVPYSGAVSGIQLGDFGISTTGSYVGDLSGDVTGNLTGSIVGDVEGNLTGSVLGDVTGAVTGDLAGNVTGSVLGNVTGSVIGNVSGLLVEASSGLFARIDMQGSQIYNLGSPVETTSPTTKQYVDSIIAGSGGLWQISGAATELKAADEVNMHDLRIINLSGPANDTDAANKKYVDDNAGGGFLV